MMSCVKVLLGGGCEQIRNPQDEPQWIVLRPISSHRYVYRYVMDIDIGTDIDNSNRCR